MLVAVVQGMNVMAKSQPGRRALQDVVDATLAGLAARLREGEASPADFAARWARSPLHASYRAVVLASIPAHSDSAS